MIVQLINTWEKWYLHFWAENSTHPPSHHLQLALPHPFRINLDSERSNIITTSYHSDPNNPNPSDPSSPDPSDPSNSDPSDPSNPDQRDPCYLEQVLTEGDKNRQADLTDVARMLSTTTVMLEPRLGK